MLIILMKKKGEKMITLIILILIPVFLGSFAQVSMKKGLLDLGGIELKELLSKKLFTTVFQKNVLTGLILYSISTLFWLVVLSKAELSFVYPLIALGYIVTAFLAKIIFNEVISPIRWLGILLIVAGAFLIIRS